MKNLTPALAYYRTSSATNVGADRDSLPRQQQAVARHAAAAGLAVVGEFYDAAVSGADPLDARPGFTALLARAKADGIDVILVETASRFARDVVVQELGLRLLAREGLRIVAADSPGAFTEETPTARLIRQLLGCVSEFEKAMTVARLKAARDRRSAARGRRIEGRKGYAETHPGLVREARRLFRRNPRTGARRSLRQISAELAALGHLNPEGRPFHPDAVRRILGPGVRERARASPAPVGAPPIAETHPA